MIQENLLVIAIIIFLILLAGLIATVVEFRHGAPKQQVEEQISPTSPKR